MVYKPEGSSIVVEYYRNAHHIFRLGYLLFFLELNMHIVDMIMPASLLLTNVKQGICG